MAKRKHLTRLLRSRQFELTNKRLFRRAPCEPSALEYYVNAKTKK
jgi:hypothetical protein